MNEFEEIEYLQNQNEYLKKKLKQLTEKYGKGTIDIESGEFTPVE